MWPTVSGAGVWSETVVCGGWLLIKMQAKIASLSVQNNIAARFKRQRWKQESGTECRPDFHDPCSWSDGQRIITQYLPEAESECSISQLRSWTTAMHLLYSLFSASTPPYFLPPSSVFNRWQKMWDELNAMHRLTKGKLGLPRRGSDRLAPEARSLLSLKPLICVSFSFYFSSTLRKSQKKSWNPLEGLIVGCEATLL